MKKFIPISIIALLILSGFALFFLQDIFTTKDESTIDDEKILYVITEKMPLFSLNSKPVIKIDSVSRHRGGWQIVTIKSLRSSEKFVPVKVVMLDTEGKLTIIAGPDTYFTESELLKYNVPDSVIMELQKS